MKKSISVLLIIVSLIIITSCSDGSSSVQEQLPSEKPSIGTGEIKQSKDVIHDMTVFSHLKANINASTKAIGLQQKESQSRGLDTYLDTLIVKQDEGHDAEPIQFEVISDTDEKGNKLIGFDGKVVKNGDIITQGIIPSKVDKLYVSEDFTFVSYVTVDAYKLFNSVNTNSNKDSNGNIYYQGNKNFNSENNDNGGYSEGLSWWYSPSNTYNSSRDGGFQINYNYHKWWYDSDHKHQQINENYSETLTLRELSNDKQAANERSGIKRYDVNGYYSSYFRKSYIIDNNTGLIYEIAGDLNLSMHRGVAIDSKLGPVDLIPQSDGSLLIKPYVESNLIAIYDVFQDLYGQIYILNDSVAEKTDGVVLFINIGEYVPAEDGRVFHFEYGDKTDGCYSNVKSVSVMGDGFTKRSVSSDDSAAFFYSTILNNPWQDLPDSLRQYNENYNLNNQPNYWNKPYQCVSTFLEIIDGSLYMQDSNTDRPQYAKLDLSTLDLSRSNYNNQDCYSVYLSNGNVLIATLKSASSLYSVSWKSLEKMLITNVSILHSNGDREWTGSSFEEFRKQYMEVADTSYGYDSDKANSYPYYYSGYESTSYEKIESYTNWDRDYVFFKKNIVGESFGFDASYVNEGIYFQRSDSERPERNYQSIITEDFTYSWFNREEVGTTLGYNKEYADNGYEMVKASDNPIKGVLEYIPAVANGYPESGYAFYDENRNFLGTGSTSDLNQYNNARTVEEYVGWIHYPNKKQAHDYQYKWYNNKHIADTHGLNPDMQKKGYYFVTDEIRKEGIPEYLYDYDYTYYTRDIIAERFGSERDYDWDDSVIGEAVSDYKYGTVRYKVLRSDYMYYYMQYKEGYDEQKVRDLFENINLDDSHPLIDEINVSNDTFANLKGFDVELLRKSSSGAVAYKIIESGSGYEAVEAGTIVSNKSSVVLQPINRA